MSRLFIFVLMLANALALGAEQATTPRPFRMGFTGFCYDITPEAVAASRKFCRENGDILCHHIEGVPWAECHAGEAFPKAMVDDWTGKKSATPANGKVYLAISPGRGELKLGEKCKPLPVEFRGKGYDDLAVQKAYLEYCFRAIEFFKPDYLAIGIEVNEIYSAGAKKFAAYAELHTFVYREIKKKHPALPVFASVTLHNLIKDKGKMLAEFQAIMEFNDIVGVSYYPFFVDDKLRLTALDWMFKQFDAFKKPYAMVETNDAADRLPLATWKVTIQGTPQKQLEYTKHLLQTAQERRFLFVINFVHQDYDALWEKIKATSPEFFVAWRDCGLLDESGKARPAYEVWKKHLEVPLAK